jgi:hypothetical protein
MSHPKFSSAELYGGPLVVREAEVGDPEVERAADDRPAALERRGRGRSST